MNESSYQEVHAVGGTANTAVTSHRVQRKTLRPGAGGDAQLYLQQKTQLDPFPAHFE